jgi:hypothetical protein
MQRTSDNIGTIAAALAKAQIELNNPEKSLTAVIASERAGEEGRSFRYAPLSSGLDIVRKTLGHHEIATVQTTAIDKEAGLIRLTTVLAHSSGEWVSSEWPVCPVSETAAPHRMGAALTYARRYALFTLFGIAGEDDLDAPDLHVPAPADARIENPVPDGQTRPSGGKKHVGRKISANLEASADLRGKLSAVLRDQLLSELKEVNSTEVAAVWARRILPAKNSLDVADARLLEQEFEVRLAKLTGEAAATEIGGRETANGGEVEYSTRGEANNQEPLPSRLGSTPNLAAVAVDKSGLAHLEPRRIRDKIHVKFVTKQPCLICGRRPSDPHHLRFAQHRALGRKVSDEFTVPLCRGHHREVHRCGDEAGWWEKTNVDPTVAARSLRLETHPLPDKPESEGAVIDADQNSAKRPGHVGKRGPKFQNMEVIAEAGEG